MANTIIAFRSRNDTLKFFELAREAGIVSSVINTPKEAMLGCGISVAFGEENLARVQRIFYTLPYKTTFLGYFRLIRAGNKNIILPIN